MKGCKKLHLEYTKFVVVVVILTSLRLSREDKFEARMINLSLELKINMTT